MSEVSEESDLLPIIMMRVPGIIATNKDPLKRISKLTNVDFNEIFKHYVDWLFVKLFSSLMFSFAMI